MRVTREKKGGYTVTKLVGILQILATFDIWFTALILYIGTDGAIFLLRDQIEGLGYQVSWSAKVGDAVLLIAVLIAATELHRESVIIPEWLQGGIIQLGIVTFCVGLGAATAYFTFGARSGQPADLYHDVVIAPAILFFAITLLPIIWYNARWYEMLAVILATLIWAGLVVYDFKTGRINQRQWLVSHGFAIKGEVPKR